MYGCIENGWETTSEAILYTSTVPVSTTATVCLPAEGTITKNGKKLKAGRDYRTENGCVWMEPVSGMYQFETDGR